MYSEKVLEYFRNPRNMGEMKDADAVGIVGNPECGDFIHIYIKVHNNKIKEISFQTFGCAAVMATSLRIIEMAKNKTLAEAMNITRNDLVDALDGLPPVKKHSSNLAADGLHEAIRNYKLKQKKEKII